MDFTNGWNVALMLAVAYVAVMTLVRLMARRRDQVVADVERQLEAHRKQQSPSRKGLKSRATPRRTKRQGDGGDWETRRLAM